MLPAHVAAHMSLERYDACINHDAEQLLKCMEWLDHHA